MRIHMCGPSGPLFRYHLREIPPGPSRYFYTSNLYYTQQGGPFWRKDPLQNNNHEIWG